jgi:hypothetical protein
MEHTFMEIGQDELNAKTAGQETGTFGPATKNYYGPNDWSLVPTSASGDNHGDVSSIVEVTSEYVSDSFLAIKPALRKSNE